MGWVPEVVDGRKPRKTGAPSGEIHEHREGAIQAEDLATDLRTKGRTLVVQQYQEGRTHPRKMTVAGREWCLSTKSRGRKEGSIIQCKGMKKQEKNLVPAQRMLFPFS